MDKYDAPALPISILCESDNEIMEDDPYFKKGCERRMVFTSDPVPLAYQYKVYDISETWHPEFLSAADKFFKWCKSRPTAVTSDWPGWNEASFRDGRRARHFVLKIGAPNGPNRDANKLASRLYAIWSHNLVNRLQSSHLTIETGIPNQFLAGTENFKAYMNQILSLIDSTKMGIA
jgi:hypothetical protein